MARKKHPNKEIEAAVCFAENHAKQIVKNVKKCLHKTHEKPDE